MSIVFLFGKVGKDPAIKQIGQKNTTVAEFSVATSKKVKEAWVTEWHNVKCFGKTAEKVSVLMHKGDTVAIKGEIVTEKWQAKDGGDRQRIVIMISWQQDIVIEPKLTNTEMPGSQDQQQTSQPESDNLPF